MSSQYEQLEPKLSNDDTPRRSTATKKKRPNSEKRKQRQPTNVDMSIEQYVGALLKQQKYRSSKSQYGTASQCKKQLQLIKSSIQERNMSILKKKFRKEEKEIQQARELEEEEMDRVWTEIAYAYQQKCSQLLQAWEQKKQKQIENLKEGLGYLQENAGRSYSKDLVTLKKAESRLAKQQQYEQAKKVHKQVKKLQKQLTGRNRQELCDKSRNVQAQLNARHERQYSALSTRIRSGRQQQKMMYEKQRRKLQLKFQNILTQHRKQQRSEMDKINRYNRLQNVQNLSRLDASWIVNNSHV